MQKFRFREYLFRYKWKYLFGFILLFVVDVANLYVPQFTGELIDGLTRNSVGLEGVKSIIFSIFAVTMIIALGRVGWRFFILGASRRMEFDLRNDMFHHLETLSQRYFNAHKTGDLMAYFTNDLEAVREACGFGMITVFDAVVMTVMIIYKMIVDIDFKLTLMAFIPLLVIAFGATRFFGTMEARQQERQNAFSHLSDKVQESLTGIRVLKAFVQEKKDLASFDEANTRNMKGNLGVVQLWAIMIPVLDLFIGTSLLVTLLVGGKLVLDGQVTIGQFVAFNSYIGMLVWPMIACGDCINTFSRASASIKRIGSIFEEVPEIISLVEDDGEKIVGDIEFRDLSFTYPDSENEVLSHINVHIRQGETLSILGRTGAGKSTVADLLLRVYDTEKDMIFIDGRPINQWTLDQLHHAVAYVPQDNFLFSDTLEENIAFGIDERISENESILDKIVAASEAACIHENIVSFPDGYKTVVGERGVTLSGGQKQRSSIARALLKNAPILILDDALSAVDTDTEKEILANIRELRENKTTIIIAHRISTLKNADHIAVLSDGKLSEYGTHDELIALGGFYAEIAYKQQLEDALQAQESSYREEVIA